MTIRDIQRSIHEFGENFAASLSDGMRVVQTEDFLDWPLWASGGLILLTVLGMFVLAVVVSLFSMLVESAKMTTAERRRRGWSPKPLPRWLRQAVLALAWLIEHIPQIGAVLLLGLLVSVISVEFLKAFAGLTYEREDAASLVAFGGYLIISAAVAYLAYRGRRSEPNDRKRNED